MRSATPGASSAPALKNLLHEVPPHKDALGLTVGKTLSGHFCYTNFWIPDPSI